LYVAGSLRNDPGGFSLQARNPLGDGTLTRIGRISVDGQTIAPEAVSATREGDPTTYRAADVSPRSPVTFRRGDVVTFHVAGWRLEPGEHALELEVDELDLGHITLTVRDRLDVPIGAPADPR
jgi:hypothetical protein